MFPYVEVFGLSIGMYSVFGVMGLIIASILAYYLGRNTELYCEDISLTAVAVIIGVMLGGHTLYALTHIGDIFSALSEISNTNYIQAIKEVASCFGGMVYYGGLIGAYISLSLFCKFFYPHKKEKIIDIFSVCVPLFHCFARIGCFCAGCCFGIESNMGFITYTNKLLPEINGVIRLPIQLIEAFVNFLIFLFLYKLFVKKHKDGKLIYFYIWLYSPIRFFIEFFRGDIQRGYLGCLSTSQWISIILFIIACICFIKKKQQPKNNNYAIKKYV